MIKFDINFNLFPMKTKLFVLIVFLFCSCTNRNESLTNSDKDKILGEAKVLINTIIDACESPDPEKLKQTYLESPDFVSLVGGLYADYNQTLDKMYSFLNNVESQKITIKGEKYMILDRTTVLYTASSRCEAKMRNDSTIIMDPLGMQFLLKKIDNNWKVISWTEMF